LHILLTGGTGFVGRALLPALLKEGHRVRALSRKPHAPQEGVEWVQADLLDRESLARAFQDIDCAFYLVHSIGTTKNYRTRELQSATTFAELAAQAGVKKIVFLGGVIPDGTPSLHLQARQETGEILRSGKVPTLELRASMIIGAGSISWQLVRDLALRLPMMVLPAWLQSRTRPVDIDDAVQALVFAARYPLKASRWFELPGPETLTGQEILERVAAQRQRHIPMLTVPLLTPRLSAFWLRFVTRAPFSVARELVQGLKQDLLPKGVSFWDVIAQPPVVKFDAAVRKALAEENPARGILGTAGRIEERVIDAVGRRFLPA